MADIQVDTREVRNDNYTLPRLISSLDNCERAIAVMKWRIPKEVRNAEELKQQLAEAQRRFRSIQDKIEKLYSQTNYCMDQYEETERILFARAKDFE